MGRTFRRQCPQCSTLVTWPDTATYPFCSERCRLIDLGLWARGDQYIPGEAAVDEETWPEGAMWDLDEEENV